MAGRGRNPRRVLVDLLMQAGKQLMYTRYRWSAWHFTSKMINPSGEPGGLRRREIHEYPEGRAQEWMDAWGQLDAMIQTLTEARDHAERQWQTFGDNAEYRLSRGGA